MFEVGLLRRKIHKKQKKNGFTLIEVLVSMLILAVIMIPIVGLITRAAQANRVSRNIQEASNLGQNIMEGLKVQNSFEDVATQLVYKSQGAPFDLFQVDNLSSVVTQQVRYDDSTGNYVAVGTPCVTKDSDPLTGNPVYSLKENAERKYQFQVSNLIYNGHKYCVLLDYDASQYSKVNPGDDNKYNDFDMPVLPAVSDDKNAVITVNYQDDWATSTLKQQYNVYHNSTTSGDITVTNDDIKNDMQRSFKITILKNASGKFVVEAEFTYSLMTLIPDGVASYPNEYRDVFYRQEFDTIENVYFFFAPNLNLKKDDIQIDNKLTGDAADFNVYFVEQEQTISDYVNRMNLYELTVELTEAEPPLSSVNNAYIYHTRFKTNLGRIKYKNLIADKVNQTALIDRDTDKTRIYNISVSLYNEPEAGTAMFKDSDYIASFTSSKGE